MISVVSWAEARRAPKLPLQREQQRQEQGGKDAGVRRARWDADIAILLVDGDGGQCRTDFVGPAPGADRLRAVGPESASDTEWRRDWATRIGRPTSADARTAPGVGADSLASGGPG